MEKAQTASATPTLDQLLTNVKEAKGDQLVDALAAVLNKLIQERKAGQLNPAPADQPSPGHQH